MPAETSFALRVTARTEAAEGVVLLDLADPGGGPLPAWAPGAHIDLRLPGHVVRQYSLTGTPDDRATWRIGVLHEREGRGGSAYVHQHLIPCAEVEVSGPRNHFVLAPAAHYVFVAGGIGITPIVPMLAHAQASGSDYVLHYGGRTRISMAFVDVLRSKHGPRCVVRPQDESGMLDLSAILAVPRADTLVYCCGPEPLLAAVEELCTNWPSGALRVERFSGRDLSPGAEPTEFHVELTLSGRTLRVPADRSVLDVIEQAGVSVLSSCHEGTCGTCETTVLAGEVHHRDSLLSGDERAAHDTMFICVSRARSARLVLEL